MDRADVSYVDDSPTQETKLRDWTKIVTKGVRPWIVRKDVRRPLTEFMSFKTCSKIMADAIDGIFSLDPVD